MPPPGLTGVDAAAGLLTGDHGDSMEQEQDTGGGFVPPALGDIVRRKAGQAEAVEAPPLEAQAEARDDKGENAAAAPGEAQAEEAGPPPANPETAATVPRAALIEERRKRQMLEQRLVELERRFQQPPQVPAPTPEAGRKTDPVEEFLTDPDAYLAKRLSGIEQKLEAQRFAASEAIVRAAAPDYDEAVRSLYEWQVEAIRSGDPVLVVHARSVGEALRVAENPADVALRYGREILAQKRAAQAAAQPQSVPQPVPAAPTIPQSLATARSAAPARTAPAWNGPPPLSEITRRR